MEKPRRGTPRPVDDQADEVLVALASDRAAFATVFERHRPMVTALVSRLFGGEEVEDVLQEAALQSLLCLGRLAELSRFGPWLRVSP